MNQEYYFMDEKAENLTPLELKIMRALQENGRLSNAELAKLVGISTSSCWNHTQRLLRLSNLGCPCSDQSQYGSTWYCGVSWCSFGPFNLTAFKHLNKRRVIWKMF